MYNTYAYFWVKGFDGSPSIFTSELGIEPTESWVKGDPDRPGRPRRESAWHLHSPLPRSEMFMDKHLEALLDLLEPKALVIQMLRSQYEVGINCVGYFHSENPGFHLAAGLITRLHALGLDVDFDLYCCAEPS